MRKNTLLIVVTALALAALYFFFLQDTRRLLFKTIPDSAIMAFEAANAQKLQQQLVNSSAYADWQRFELVSKLEGAFITLNTLFLKDKASNSFSLLGSLHATKSDDYDVLLYTTPEALRMRLPDLIDSLSRQGIPSTMRTFKGCNIYEFTLPKQQVFTIAQDGKVVIASAVPILVDEAIAEYHRFFSGGFIRFAKIRPSENNGLAVHLNFKNLPLLETIFLKSGIRQSVFNLLQNNFQYASFNLNLNNSGIALNGTINATENLFLQPVLDQNCPNTVNIACVLPYNTALLFYNRANDLQKLVRQQKNTLFAGSHEINWAGKEWAFGFTEPPSGTIKDNAFAAIAIADSGKAVATLQGLHLKGNKPQTYKGYTLNAIQAQHIMQYLFGESIAPLFAQGYYTTVNNFALFAGSKEHLQVILENIMAKQTLDTDKRYKHFETNLQPHSNTFVYILPERMIQLIKETASQTFLADFAKKSSYYQRFTPIGFQLAKSGNDIEAEGTISYTNATEKEKETAEAPPTTLVWNLNLDAEAATTPQVVKNTETGEKELMVLDKNNNLYLISRNGKILWKRQFDKPVLGKIQQIDIYNNGNLYYLFNTSNRIYLLNRSGEDVQNYPIKLSSAAVEGLLAVDFEGNKEYSFFVPCGNNNVYGYHQSGKPLNGWSPRPNLSLIVYGLQYFSYDGKQYLVAANKNGNIYLLAPDGTQIQKIPLGSPLVSPPQIDLRNGAPKIVATARNSQTYVIGIDGQKWGKKYVSVSPTAGFFTANLNADANEEYLFMSNNKVYAYSDKKKLFDYPFNKEPHPNAIFPIRLSAEKYTQIGVFCQNAQQIYLLNNEGEVHSDFPLPAVTPFITYDLFDNGGDILVAGGTDNNLFAYKMK